MFGFKRLLSSVRTNSPYMLEYYSVNTIYKILNRGEKFVIIEKKNTINIEYFNLNIEPKSCKSLIKTSDKSLVKYR